jgi:hypothetical protein
LEKNDVLNLTQKKNSLCKRNSSLLQTVQFNMHHTHNQPTHNQTNIKNNPKNKTQQNPQTTRCGTEKTYNHAKQANHLCGAYNSA